MKSMLFAIGFVCLNSFVFSQSIAPAPSDKAVIYFVRASSLGVLINFSYFDGDGLIGRFNGPKYMRYECDAGDHLFWARSENRDFVEAKVEAGKIYLIDVLPKMGGVKAAVRLVPVEPKNHKMKKILKLLAKKEPVNVQDVALEETEEKLAEVIKRGLEKYEKMKTKNKAVKTLGPEMSFEPADLKYVK